MGLEEKRKEAERKGETFQEEAGEVSQGESCVRNFY